MIYLCRYCREATFATVEGVARHERECDERPREPEPSPSHTIWKELEEAQK